MSNTVTIKASLSAEKAGSDAQSSVLWVKKHDFAMYNINVVNGFGTGTNTQAVALTVHGLRQAYYSCSFTSFQDTLYAHIGLAYFSGCNIEGAVDFIFGDARAWFERGTIGVKQAHSIATITANKRSTANDSSAFIFDQVSIVPIDGAQLHSAYLGRPWASYARVVFQFCNISNVINPAGWLAWNLTSDSRTDHVEFGEYENIEEVSSIKRRYGKQLAAKIEITDVLGTDYQTWT
ncbi:hypothetical protein CROQUDRAFT_72010 [Cronartium quercuum f. sp. fusiforme G11]|uniref:Pectinesterase n=1 Tax=Cronartium quercuum f. sp. fusiforme G11 TaxID=708437 RepID=A0A9P6NX82_9BASI|nr:hypothetical protein CROQUDRAFT_72010 [Cronartium quercuum f. sp. fusiforme G11]